jgi:hypothetical protein
MALSSSNISPTCGAKRPMFDPLCQLRPRPGSPPGPQRPGPFSSVSSWPPPRVSCYRTCAADRTAARRAASPSAMAATNKCLAQSNKSRTAGAATKRRFRQICVLPEDNFTTTMTLQEAKSIARHLGLTLRQVRSGAYRVNFRDGDETTAYYTDNLEEAVNTVLEKARKRGQSPC